LCDKAQEFLKRQQRLHGFTFAEIDIDRDAELRERHDRWVPVIEVNGRVRFRGGINPFLWNRLLAALGRSAERI
jgi:glutaredoxin